jgi:hypothetical protein
MVVCLGIYWRVCRKYPEAAMLLGVLPLFLAWRSLPSYFYCVAYPLFILLAARYQEGRKQKVTQVLREELTDEALQIPTVVV